MGIIPDHVSDVFQKEKGYAHTYSLPREWSLAANGNLKQKPIVELERLRGKNYNYKNVLVTTNQTNLLTEPKGRQLELRAKIATQNAVRMGFEIAKSADGTEKTRIYYDFITGYLTVDRNASSTNPSVPRSQFGLSYPINQGDTLDLHIFFDGSVLEVFLNEDIVISTHIFPAGTQSTGVDLFTAGGTAQFLNVDVWEMKDMTDPSVGTAETLKQTDKTEIAVFPNPVTADLTVNVDFNKNDNTQLTIVNILGKTLQIVPIRETATTFSVAHLPNGLYFLDLKTDNHIVSTTKFYKN